MLQNEVIEESNSPYTFNVVVVGKKDDAGEGMDRLCINYAPLNKLTILDFQNKLSHPYLQNFCLSISLPNTQTI